MVGVDSVYHLNQPLLSFATANLHHLCGSPRSCPPPGFSLDRLRQIVRGFAQSESVKQFDALLAKQDVKQLCMP